jgi:hypothetical protein
MIQVAGIQSETGDKRGFPNHYEFAVTTLTDWLSGKNPKL